MNVVFGGMIIFSFVFACATGRLEQLSQAVLEQAGGAVTLVLSLVGVLCLWSGLMKVAEQAGVTKQLCKALSPVTKFLFRGIRETGAAASAISMNLVANLLGLGNAATPLGIRAICELKKEQHTGAAATDNMAMLVVLNTASIQLIPATTALLRLQNGSAAPLEILPAVWVASACSVTAGIVMARMLAPFWGKQLC